MGDTSEVKYPLCSICEFPMVPGQAFNGLKKAHWTCAPGKSLDSTLRRMTQLKGGVAGKKAFHAHRPIKPEQEARFAWIESWMRESRDQNNVDILDSAFIRAYIEAHDAKFSAPFIGAPRCEQLRRDLGTMFRIGRLTRTAQGLPAGDASMGFPKWIYSYTLKDQ
jgi:hypothetical protein